MIEPIRPSSLYFLDTYKANFDVCMTLIVINLHKIKTRQCMEKMSLKERIKSEFMVIKALGVVYGDIGTSPIYTFTVIFLLIAPTVQNVYGILSLVVWTLTVLVTVQYAWLATSLSKHGEGGTVVLTQILTPYLKNAKQASIVAALSFVGISLMIGDGVITPAISILSAVEGIVLIPGYENMGKIALLLIATGIAFALFVVQKKGVERVATAFGPIMVIWFFAILGAGLWALALDTSVLSALSPHYAVEFIVNNPLSAFILLADVILCATGGEALYADMGHLGRLPILKGWIFVFVALAICYFGQGAFLLAHPQSKSVLFEMVQSAAPLLYAPFLILCVIATIIASQAMISGIFSVLYQAMTTRIFPHFKVEYTSNELRSQIYVGSINWFLFICVVAMLFIFGESSKLAAAYGLAVSGAMVITATLMSFIFWYRNKTIAMIFSVISAFVSGIFFASCLLKIPHGGFWSLIIAAVPLFIVMLYTRGQERLYASFVPVKKDEFLDEYTQKYPAANKIQGTALYFARHISDVPAYIPKTMFDNGILYERNIIVTVKPTNEPQGVHTELSPLAEGLDLLVIKVGYLEMLDVEAILESKNIDEKTIFYGQEEIVSANPFWILFAMIKSLSPSFVHFYKFPRHKLIGISRRAVL
jgi:KUP system potassium uptake protein